jgi:DNA-directed RNA polymerase subunit F
MIKDKKPLTMYEATEVIDKLKETDKAKELQIFIEKFSELNVKEAKKIKEALEKLDIAKLKQADVVKIVEIFPDSATELNKIFSETSLDTEETSKILDAIKNSK